MLREGRDVRAMKGNLRFFISNHVLDFSIGRINQFNGHRGSHLMLPPKTLVPENCFERLREFHSRENVSIESLSMKRIGFFPRALSPMASVSNRELRSARPR